MINFTPRPSQAEVLKYKQGKLGIAAVPGSGKTHTLSYLAAQLLASESMQDDQEILVVTLVNSAVQNFSQRISAFIKQFGLMESIGYRVRTLHGLAHDIVRERPDIAGLENNFQIIDERTSSDLLDQIVVGWQRSHAEIIQSLTKEEMRDNQHQLAMKWKAALLSTARSFIGQAKDMQLTPAQVNLLLSEIDQPNELMAFGAQVYEQYQNALAYQASIDFQDLIRLAYFTIQQDQEYLERLRYRWPYILEDEAQDSSNLQENILRTLCGPHGNWVRVGDPNQAIFKTFTTADPKYLLRFLKEKDVKALELPNSGRSTQSIINLANHLITWNKTQPSSELAASLVPPFILTTSADDPQPNPIDDPEAIHLITQKYSSEGEQDQIVRSVAQWVKHHPDQTVAILVTRNDKGASIVQKLKDKKVPTVELLQTSFSTRQTAKTMAAVLHYLSDPSSVKKFTTAFNAVYRDRYEKMDLLQPFKNYVARLRKLDFLEKFIFSDEQAPIAVEGEIGDLLQNSLTEFIAFLKTIQNAVLLPINQLILTISMHLFQAPEELALNYKLAEFLQNAQDADPKLGLAGHAALLDQIQRNRLRMQGFAEEDLQFDPDQHKGQVVVSTIHKAKGLEWDRVYILSVNNYDFPSNQPYDQYLSERYFMRDQLNLEAETLAQLKALVENRTITEGQASKQARIEYSAERLRLLYVGITRARKELVMTWNEGKFNNCVIAVSFEDLSAFWEGQNG